MELARKFRPVAAPHVDVAVPSSAEAFAQAVATGLTGAAKTLPPWMLYDDVGSDLFEQITDLPEYYLTRTERAILTERAGEMLDAAGAPRGVAELGAGSASKTRVLLEALLAQRESATYFPVDVSPSLPEVAEELRRRYPQLTVNPISARYPEELGWLRSVPRRRLVLFLGSSIGNYDRHDAAALLRGVRAQLATGDALLLGTDLVKPASVLVPAYDDAQGVTARFNKNVLARINRELGGHFDLDAFRHLVRWNPALARMELYLCSERDQVVAIEGLHLRVRFTRGELLHTENSHKFTADSVRSLLLEAGFALEQSWSDPAQLFALHLARA
jgi:dimethylhistidine N-methyltransferase